MSEKSGSPFARFARFARAPSRDLGKMDVRDLFGAFFTYPTVILYLALLAGSTWAAVEAGALRTPLRSAAAIPVAVMAYPLIWYVLHRWVLHGRLLYKHPLTAALWKRVHFDHHQDPHRLDVLFGSPFNTVPTIAATLIPLGWLIGGWGAAWTAFGAGIATTLVYEYCHCIQHLNFSPRNPWLVKIKTLHLAHHFHNETGNYGIISFWPDMLFGTFYGSAQSRPRSATVFNLGYHGEQAERYPWVARRTRRRAG